MTSAEPRPAPPKRIHGPWRGFRHWRRTRPFWGGLLTALAGLEIFGTTQMSLAGLAFQMGPTGFLSWLIPTILVTCGLLMWFKLHHRMLYAVVAVVTVLFSLVGVNLGGFFIGLLLGLVGSALGFAWAPDTYPPTTGRSEAAGDGTARDEAAGDKTTRDEGGGGTAGDGTPDDGKGRDEPSTGGKGDLPAPEATPSAGRRPSSAT